MTDGHLEFVEPRLNIREQLRLAEIAYEARGTELGNLATKLLATAVNPMMLFVANGSADTANKRASE